MPTPSLHAAAAELSRLLDGVTDGDLDAPTPCEELPLGGLLDHVGTFAKVFTATARKDLGERTAKPPAPSAANLEDGWRARMAADLTALAEAWDVPEAWEGMSRAGGQDLPGDVAGRIALDELVVHGWDVAQASRQPFDCDAEALEVVEATVRQFRDGFDGDMPGLWNAVVSVPDDAPALHRVLGLTGRDPAWSPS